MKKIILSILLGISIPNILFSFTKDDMQYSYKNMECTQISEQNREITINAVIDGYIKIEQSVTIVSGTLHQLSFKNEMGKEYIVYVMSSYDACMTFDSLVKNPNIDFDVSETIELIDSETAN